MIGMYHTILHHQGQNCAAITDDNSVFLCIQYENYHMCGVLGISGWGEGEGHQSVSQSSGKKKPDVRKYSR